MASCHVADLEQRHSSRRRPLNDSIQVSDLIFQAGGLKAEQICLGAQILMLAEAANTIFEHGQKSKNLARLSVLLKLN